MYNQSYDDYIRSILGYPNNNDMNIYQNQNNYQQTRTATSNLELEECYPEIYKVVYPMIKKACQNVTGPVTKDTIDNMTNEIYMNVEGNDEVYLNINLNNDIENSVTINKNNIVSNNRSISNGESSMTMEKNNANSSNRTMKFEKEAIKDTRESRSIGDVRETRQFNRGLSDIIRILILRELLGRPGGSCPPWGCQGNRPPFPPPPNRPPFGPPQGPGRPPFRPPFNRDLDNIYEY